MAAAAAAAAAAIIGLDIIDDDDGYDDGGMTKAETIILWIFVGIIGAIVALGLLVMCCECNFCGIPWLIKKICKGIYWVVAVTLASIMVLVAAPVLAIAKVATWTYNKAEAGVRIIFRLPPKPKKKKANNQNNDPEMGNVQHSVGFAERAGGAGLLPHLQKPAPAAVVKPKNAPKKRARPIQPIQHGRAPSRGCSRLARSCQLGRQPRKCVPGKTEIRRDSTS